MAAFLIVNGDARAMILNGRPHWVRQRTDRGRRFGFTLIELLVVMATMALLLAIALPRYFGSIDKSKEVALKQNLQILRTTIDKFYGDRARFPDTLDELVTQKYLRAVPVDPVTESAATWILLPSAEADAKGIADVKSGAPGKTRDGEAFEDL